MVWQCRLIEYKKETNGQTLSVGDMFYGPTLLEAAEDAIRPQQEKIGLSWPFFFCRPEKLSPYYKEHNSHRPPLMIFMPGRMLHCLDSMAWKNNVYFGPGWIVTGEAPNITVSPSLDMGSNYHGFIQNGIILDDVAGLKYDADGRNLVIPTLAVVKPI